MTEEKKEQPKNVAVDLECDDEFEEFGNEGKLMTLRTRRERAPISDLGIPDLPCHFNSPSR
jgi:hypothetical protein|tara:strand:- start:1485 stop:1667 length:183 start_codon:yes stop_codon:yes gene_type:complete